ncbi:MAG: hypothetical protein IJF76_05180, partial [Clostridia bacterium]|nr:hypothetical protein [Clostridia bacterium]
NVEFKSIAFNALQSSVIIPTFCETGTEIYDELFLLSHDDVLNSEYGFSDNADADEKRVKLTTDYARANGCLMSTFNSTYGNGWWWLSSSHDENGELADCIFTAGGASNYNCHVSREDGGVVPALRIQLD